ncbi:MAG: heme ABC exporter ATP-binding protein CcmA [Hyphomicrobiaceae bacterium]
MELCIADLAVSRGERTVLSGVSFTVRAGEALIVTGVNGAGKTTLLHTVAGFVSASAGTIRLDGGSAEHSILEQCHLIGHANGIKASLTVAENAEFWARYLGGSDAFADSALERLGLSHIGDVPAGYLSAGQKRRLGLSRLLLAQRPLWLLDEPTAWLDAAGEQTVAAMIETHLDGGGLVLAASHLPLDLARKRELRLEAKTATP